MKNQHTFHQHGAPSLEIGHCTIGAGHRPYIIAELGVNHDGSLDRALELTDMAADCGVDAVKLQCFEAQRLMSRASQLASYQERAGERDPVEMLRRLELPLAQMRAVVQRAHERGIHALVTVFSVELVEEAATIPWDAFKTASPDIIHLPLLESLMTTGRPLIISTGASTLEEVERAAHWLAPAADRTMFMQCVSSYPTPPGLEAFEGIGAIATATGRPCGYSDHTPATDTGARACEAGAVALEKHITWSTAAAGPDHAASLDRRGLQTYCRLVRQGHEAGRSGTCCLPPRKEVLEIERDVRRVSRQSLVATRPLPAGHRLTRSDLTIKRPGTGLPPWMLTQTVGATLAGPVAADTPLLASDILTVEHIAA
ncbi:MAG: N-acetylneuraminate synthase family protein [Planctomycetota bacterium]|nr:N-acetylneuraminate synthase family protein [Planctomycetota bacterium]